jgi:uncharacterized repeat protein (TIGR03803 family)
MQSKKALIPAFVALAVALGSLTNVPGASAASKEKVLHSFKGKDGAYPNGDLVVDAAGNFYGTTEEGGDVRCNPPSGCGTVFELTPTASGPWIEKVLHRFCCVSRDGLFPHAGLVIDTAGSLYGTTPLGGVYQSGIVFRLTRGNGKWAETVLYSFNDKDGRNPAAGLIFDPAGNLYGTTQAGGTDNQGIAFQLTPNGKNRWTETVLHSFQKNGKDGFQPNARLVMDAAGNLYGTTFYGGGLGCGGYGCGIVFELKPEGGGKWTERVLHNFQDTRGDGVYPTDALILDTAGNLYSTTIGGGAHGSKCQFYGCGTAFQLGRDNNGKWAEKVLHTFRDNGRDGVLPSAGFIFDAAGNLYSTTSSGGAGWGTIFNLMPGKWTETIVHRFNGNGRFMDGFYPSGNLIFDAAGNLYGTTYGASGFDCSENQCGTVFEVTP